MTRLPGVTGGAVRLWLTTLFYGQVNSEGGALITRPEKARLRKARIHFGKPGGIADKKE